MGELFQLGVAELRVRLSSGGLLRARTAMSAIPVHLVALPRRSVGREMPEILDKLVASAIKRKKLIK